MNAAGDPVRVQAGGRTLRLTNLDKVLYPGTETTKGEVLHYYAQVADPLLRVLEGRPVTRVRWPDGTGGMSFFEKNLPSGAPSWLPRATIASRDASGDQVTYPLVTGIADLTYLANLASLELHAPQWRLDTAGRPDRPDRLVIDLDPGAPAGLQECARLSLVIKELLESSGFATTVPVTSGSKGMQVYAAADGSLTSEEIRDWTKHLAQTLTTHYPEEVVWKMTRSLRRGKVLVDWSQNTAAKTTIAPYSLRGKDRPTVAAPRTWEEIDKGAQSAGALRQLDLQEVLTRLDRDGDLFVLSR